MSTRKKKTVLIQRRTGKTKEDRLAKTHYALLITSFLLFVFNYVFFQEEILGHDMRYDLYVFWGPILLGCLALTIYQWETIRHIFEEAKTIKDYAIAIFFLPLLGLLISYLSLGSFANMTFVYLNKREAQQHLQEVIHCPVSRFYDSRRSHTIDFKFNNRHESFGVSYKDIKPYLSVNPKDYELEIIVRKGIWNYYVVENWDLQKH